MMGWYDNSIGWGGWFAMIAMMVIFWGLVIFAVIALFRGTTREAGPTGAFDPAGPQSPMKTLDERFARGEIDAEEYHARQAVLRDAVH